MLKTFDEVFDDYTKYGTKIKTEQYETIGTNIIIDQGQSDIAGYTDQSEGLFTDVPVIVFGDHTRIIKYINRPFFLGADGTKILKSKIPDANYKYLYYALKNAKIPNTGYNRHFKWLKQISISYPEHEKQSMIVEILDKLEDSIDNYNTILGLLDKLVKARFIEMFGTLDDPADEFEKATLKKLCNKITDGKHGGCTSEEGTQRYFVGAREIYDDEVHYDTAPEINVEEFEKDYKRCNIEIGDFLIVNTGATIGKSAIASDERTEHTLLQKSVALLKIKKDKLNPVFLKWCYRVNTRMYMVQSASAQPNLLLSKINGTVIYVPSIERQNQFADFVQQVDKSEFEDGKELI